MVSGGEDDDGDEAEPVRIASLTARRRALSMMCYFEQPEVATARGSRLAASVVY